MDEQQDRVTLRHYIEQLFESYKTHHNREHQLIAENVEHVSRALDIRLEGMNEFRAQILHERGAMVTNDKFEAKITALDATSQAQHDAMRARIVMLETGVAALRAQMVALGASITVGLLILELVLRFVVKG